MNKPNQEFVRHIERQVKVLAIYQNLPYETALERARKQATKDLLDGHIYHDPKSGVIVQPEVCDSRCIRCRLGES